MIFLEEGTPYRKRLLWLSGSQFPNEMTEMNRWRATHQHMGAKGDISLYGNTVKVIIYIY